MRASNVAALMFKKMLKTAEVATSCVDRIKAVAPEHALTCKVTNNIAVHVEQLALPNKAAKKAVVSATTKKANVKQPPVPSVSTSRQIATTAVVAAKHVPWNKSVRQVHAPAAMVRTHAKQPREQSAWTTAQTGTTAAVVTMHASRVSSVRIRGAIV